MAAGQRRTHTQTHARTQVHAPDFLAGDVLLFAGTGDLYSKVGRWIMRGEHEPPTYAVHTAQFLDSRRVLEMDMTVGIRTFTEVLNRRYGGRHRGFEVWRCTTLAPEQRSALTCEAMAYVNVRFGFVKLWAHLVDDLVCKLLHRDVFFFRHIDPQDRHPVCSGITASVYDRALHYRFGVDPECADPDQIYDWVSSHPGEWERIFRRQARQQRRANRGFRAAG